MSSSSPSVSIPSNSSSLSAPAAVDSSSSSSSSSSSTEDWFSEKNVLILVLGGLLILSFVGINLLSVSGNILEYLADTFGPLVRNVASIFGYSTGELINTTADIAADTAKFGVDIAEGTLQNVGNLLKDASKGGMDAKDRQNLDRTLQSPKCSTAAEPDAATSNIQSASKGGGGNWCLTGEYQGARGCVAMSEHDKCMSGQVFPTQKMCLNPALQQQQQFTPSTTTTRS